MWPSLVTISEELTSLGTALKEQIDACQINEDEKLEWLLATKRSQVRMEEWLGSLSGGVSDEVMRVLELRCRAPVYGLYLGEGVVGELERLQREVRTHRGDY